MAYEVGKERGYTVVGQPGAEIVILMDSIAWARPYALWTVVVAACIEDMLKKRVCIVCFGGARILNGDYKKMYEVVMKKLPCKYILVVSFGNDVYRLPKQGVEYFDAFVNQLGALQQYGHVGLVYGGSSRMSQYDDPEYDENVRGVCEACRHSVAYVTTGDILGKVELADRIGHVRAQSAFILMRHCVKWVLEFVSSVNLSVSKLLACMVQCSCREHVACMASSRKRTRYRGHRIRRAESMRECFWMYPYRCRSIYSSMCLCIVPGIYAYMC